MPDTTLRIYVAGSALDADPNDIQPWKPLLNYADSIALVRDNVEAVRVGLGGCRRWISFNRIVGGSRLYCIGYQMMGVQHPTYGVIVDGNAIAGSDRKTLVWLYPGGRVEVE